MEQPYYDGKIYFATDTNQIILDANNSKHIMGGGGSGNGSGITYAQGTEAQIIKMSDNIVLSVSGVSRTYGRRIILNEICFEVLLLVSTCEQVRQAHARVTASDDSQDTTSA